MLNPMYGAAMYAAWLEGQLRMLTEMGKAPFYRQDWKKQRRRAWKRRRSSGFSR